MLRASALTDEDDSRLEEETDAVMELCVCHLPASKERLNEYRKSQATDLFHYNTLLTWLAREKEN